MTSCEGARRLMPAYLDGELVGDERAEVERHVAACPACAAALRAESAVASALQAAPRHSAPERLRERVERLLQTAERRARWRRRAHRLALATAVLLAVALILAPRHAWREAEHAAPQPSAPDQPSAFVRVAADTHLRHAGGQLPLEVASEQPEALTAWFAGKLPFALALPRYPEGEERRPYRLRGGRLVSYDGDYAAFVAYEIDGRPLSLVVTSASRAQPSGEETVPFGRLTFFQQPVAGLSVISWSDRGLTYALVSELHETGARSCLVCHGTPEERRRIEGFGRPRRQTRGGMPSMSTG